MPCKGYGKDKDYLVKVPKDVDETFEKVRKKTFSKSVAKDPKDVVDNIL